MNILGIDTSGPVAACAVQIDGRIVHSIQLLHGKTHSEAIMPAIDSALEASGLTPNSLDLIGVTVGPGSFTGVRIGVCAAKGLAHANDIPCVAIDSLEALAMNLYGFAGIVAPILDARRNQVYCAQFDMSTGFPVRIAEDQAIDIETFLAQLPFDRKIAFCGDGLDTFRASIVQLIGERAIFAPSNLRDIHAEAVCALAENKLDMQTTGKTLFPLYLRKPQAERERNARVQRETLQ
ncbi:MAG: tRNA (adenosine(37)-N6)-threonylcarbamoyltransferase complex dimerization subunit type 1 TsaB [Clostridia bacterium]|nr:tRNA (adenosine(37)-N6)-threonylcarbamoyltransferase complex dimerization subunit type 1 TsaB [Clostridia bacterium]